MDRRRKAGRTFWRDMMGQVPLGYAILRHGYKERAELTSLLQEWARIKTSKDHKEAEEQKKTKRSHPELAEAAYAARRRYKDAAHLQRKVDREGLDYYNRLSWKENGLLGKFHSGSLHKQKLAANSALGHGEGSDPTLSLAQMISLEHESKDLREYMARDS